MKALNLFDSKVSFSYIDDRGVLSLIDLIRQGSSFLNFLPLLPKVLFLWENGQLFFIFPSVPCNATNRKRKAFDALQSEKSLKLPSFYKKGVEVFGDENKF